jgi:hypothetical protein
VPLLPFLSFLGCLLYAFLLAFFSCFFEILNYHSLHCLVSLQIFPKSKLPFPI